MKQKIRRGQAVVEMALVIPLFLLVVMGIIDFGRAMHAWSALNLQCVEAARVGAKRRFLLFNNFDANSHASLSKVQDAFWRNLSPLTPRADVTGPVIEGVGDSSKIVKVSCSFNMNLITPVLGSLVGGESKGGGLTLSATAEQGKE